MHNIVKWPALLIIEDDDLLYFLSSAEELEKELENHYFAHTETCKLLDHTGQQFLISLPRQDTGSPPYTLQPSSILDLAELNYLIRKHLSARQQCCVLKIEINSYEQGFQLVSETIED